MSFNATNCMLARKEAQILVQVEELTHEQLVWFLSPDQARKAVASIRSTGYWKVDMDWYLESGNKLSKAKVVVEKGITTLVTEML